ncbi:type VI secretion system membrane subunit TssM [Vibrio paucivorans]|uniref:Type VI secretion system membrane subunit TssM n=1 Tax=Vibrio paucivorans TaxID=2829489 RepID=A0A9X3HQW7_9VIBR|nr:type VI secretion system membrane subunit TssM [Vibrio paucivorans]MCW8332982.1 type VI secretion system membrane subunit TssM [Vibrio paucivorans]
MSSNSQSSSKDSKQQKKSGKLKAILVSLLIFVLVYALTSGGLWFTSFQDQLAALLIIGFVTALIGAFVTYWLMTKSKRKSETNSQERILIAKRKKLLSQHFARMLKLQKRKKRLNSRYDQPIYLMLSSDPQQDKTVITQMGYEAYKLDDFGNDIEFPILFWLSEHSILISVSTGEDQHPEYLKTLCQCLMKWRPRQAVNGVLLTTEVSLLLDSNESISQYADEMKSVITTFNQTFGLSLPVYNVVTNLGSISDFCQFFSGFDESKRDDVFGATIPYQKHGGIDANWFNEQYDHLIGQLIANMSNALSGQLNQEYRNSIASAPFQFGLLKQNLWQLLQRLYRGEQLSDGLMFRGFYFTHNGQDHEQNDLLASTINYSLGNESFQQHEQIPVHQTLFAQHLMSHVVLNEHELVGVNKRKENSLLFAQVGYTFAWVGLFAATLAVLKLDFDYQSQREARADAMLERYKEAISASPYDIENMAGNIPNLYSLHTIYSLYLEPDPWYTLPFMPSSSIKTDVEEAYFTELEQVLVPSMENTLEKDLFVYVNLEDQAKTLSLLNNYRLLFNEKRTNIEELKNYFVNSLKDQGEADSANVAQLTILLDEVFARNLVPIKANTDLESLAKKVINQTGVETLLYDHILNSDSFSNRIDVRSELGSNFQTQFSFSPEYVGYLVPHIYTPTGFNELDLSVDSPILREALQAYEGVAGASPSAAELHRISRDLKQQYQNDYINYWRDFVRHIEVTPVTTPSDLNRAVNTLSIASDNPISNLYTTVSKYTSVEIMAPQIADDANPDAPKEEQLQDVDKKEAARQITLSFQHYHKMIKPNEQNQKPIDILLEYFTASQKWLTKFYESNEPEKLAYQTLSATLKAENPILVLSQQSSGHQEVIQQLIKNITNQANEMVLSLAHEHLNSSWKSEVYSPYQQTLASFYPFNRSSKIDASVADVKAFFANEGTIDTFHNTRLKGFVIQEDNTPFLAGLLDNSGLALDPELWQMIDKAKDIRQALFLSDPNNVTVQFKLKATSMSPNLTEFSISADKAIFTYRHGPTLWSEQAWLGDAQLEEKLSINLKAQTASIANEDYSGNWNWFRLIEPRVKSANAQNTQVEFEYGDSSVSLSIKTAGQANPFVPGFFSGFTLPNDI